MPLIVDTSSKERTQAAQTKIKEALRLWDTDRGGLICKKELPDVSGDESKQTMAVMMALFDQDGDGKLSYQEFGSTFNSFCPMLKEIKVSPLNLFLCIIKSMFVPSYYLDIWFLISDIIFIYISNTFYN